MAGRIEVDRPDHGSDRQRGIALELARAGARIVVNYRREADAAAQTVRTIEALGSSAIALQADVGDWPAVQGMTEKALAHFGQLDIVVANSGIPLGRPGQPEEVGKAAVYLASDDANFVTGKILRVDGGMWM